MTLWLKRVCCAFIFFTVNKVKNTNFIGNLKKKFCKQSIVLLKKIIGNTQSNNADESADIIYSNIMIFFVSFNDFFFVLKNAELFFFCLLLMTFFHNINLSLNNRIDEKSYLHVVYEPKLILVSLVDGG